jgi:hypothetical protein
MMFRSAVRGRWAIALAAFVVSSACIAAPRKNGFLLEPSSVPAREIRRGGPSRSEIPALVHPLSVPAGEASWDDDERVIGVAVGGQTRAYPVSMLVRHELVNDLLGGKPILVSYCPLCGTGIVYYRRVDGQLYYFAVSGLLYRSGLLMYDLETESLWSQIGAQALVGPVLGSRLKWMPSKLDTWGRWKQRHPETTVLHRDVGMVMDYRKDPYRDYARSREIREPVEWDRRYHPKLWTLGVRLPDGSARAYPASEVQAAGGAVTEQLSGVEIRIAYDEATRAFAVEAPEGVEYIQGYWFAWSAFHPDTSVYTAPGER